MQPTDPAPRKPVTEGPDFAAIAREIVRMELEVYHVSPRIGAAPFDIRAAIEQALRSQHADHLEAAKAATATERIGLRLLLADLEAFGVVIETDGDEAHLDRLASCKAKPGHILDEHGVVRKVEDFARALQRLRRPVRCRWPSGPRD